MSFTSLYTGATGIVAHETGMEVLANNLANVSTVGFKKSDTQFADLISQQMVTGSTGYDSGSKRASQIGMGVSVGEIRNIFTEGGLETSTEATDLAITGEGFFGVRNATASTVGTSDTLYTRAGDFRFDSEAYLVDPSGYRVQGYAIDRATGAVSSTVTDIQLPYDDVQVSGETVRMVRSDPAATTTMEMVTNLDATATDVYSDADDPFFSMLSAYDGNNSNGSPFGSNEPAYLSSLDVYDADGNNREMTVYYDPVASSTISNASPGYTYWEYLVAVSPEADGSSAYNTSSAGLAGVGVLTFDGSGQLVEHTAYELVGTSGAGGKELGNWQLASFDTDGNPEMSFTFGSNGGAIGTTQSIGYSFGLTSTSSQWQPGAGTAAGIGTDASNLVSLSDQERGVRSTTSYDTSSSTLYQIQDGYTWGYLENTSVDRDGVLSGHFTNGQSEELYQVTMYRFNSEWGLRRAGGNHFLATQASGAAVAGTADSGGRGTIQQNTLEMSNVDMAEEFATMIITQRGFQANTKVISTTDSLLNTTISVKR